MLTAGLLITISVKTDDLFSSIFGLLLTWVLYSCETPTGRFAYLTMIGDIHYRQPLHGLELETPCLYDQRLNHLAMYF